MQVGLVLQMRVPVNHQVEQVQRQVGQVQRQVGQVLLQEGQAQQQVGPPQQQVEQALHQPLLPKPQQGVQAARLLEMQLAQEEAHLTMQRVLEHLEVLERPEVPVAPAELLAMQVKTQVVQPEVEHLAMQARTLVAVEAAQEKEMETSPSAPLHL